MSDVFQISADDWLRLKRQVTWLRIGVGLCLLLAAVAMCLSFNSSSGGILRVKGLVITDASGRDRILLGAPVPDSRSRLRQDSATDSLVFLAKDGVDRLAIGQAPEPVMHGKTVRRIGDNNDYGMTLYDTHGNERGAFGFLGMGRVILGMDRPSGDAIGMYVDDKTNYAGLLLNYDHGKDAALSFGTSGTGLSLLVGDVEGTPRASLEMAGTQAPHWQISAPQKRPVAQPTGHATPGHRRDRQSTASRAIPSRPGTP